jgi:hypothetical protein
VSGTCNMSAIHGRKGMENIFRDGRRTKDEEAREEEVRQ